jgi:hypothetical protein
MQDGLALQRPDAQHETATPTAARHADPQRLTGRRVHDVAAGSRLR